MKRQKPATEEAPSLSEPEKRNVWEMYMAGWGAAEIEKETGVLSNVIRKWVFREGWTAQRDRINQMHDKLHPAAQQPIIKAVAKNPKGEMREQYLKNTGKIAVEDAKHWAEELDPMLRLAAAPAIVALDKMHRSSLEIDSENESKGGNTLISLSFLTNPVVRELTAAEVKEITHAEPPATLDAT